MAIEWQLSGNRVAVALPLQGYQQKPKNKLAGTTSLNPRSDVCAMVAAFLKVATLRCSQTLTANFHILQIVTDEGTRQSHSCTAHPLQKCNKGFTKRRQDALLLRTHVFLHFLPKRVIAHIELWRAPRNLKDFEARFLLGVHASPGPKACRVVILKQRELATARISILKTIFDKAFERACMRVCVYACIRVCVYA